MVDFKDFDLDLQRDNIVKYDTKLQRRLSEGCSKECTMTGCTCNACRTDDISFPRCK